MKMNDTVLMIIAIVALLFLIAAIGTKSTVEGFSFKGDCLKCDNNSALYRGEPKWCCVAPTKKRCDDVKRTCDLNNRRKNEDANNTTKWIGNKNSRKYKARSRCRDSMRRTCDKYNAPTPAPATHEFTPLGLGNNGTRGGTNSHVACNSIESRTLQCLLDNPSMVRDSDAHKACVNEYNASCLNGPTGVLPEETATALRAQLANEVEWRGGAHNHKCYDYFCCNKSYPNWKDRCMAGRKTEQGIVEYDLLCPNIDYTHDRPAPCTPGAR